VIELINNISSFPRKRESITEAFKVAPSYLGPEMDSRLAFRQVYPERLQGSRRAGMTKLFFRQNSPLNLNAA
jgi:hypothetical protein